MAVATASLCGAVVGLERQIRRKPAGIRTSILICLGTAVYIRLGEVLPQTHVDPTRVLGQVVTGVGFIGAGVMLAREKLVLGVTSAAVIWILAGIGSAVGFGYYSAAMLLALVTVGVLTGVEVLERGVRSLRAGDSRGNDRSDER
jgi:putative Mg2+ transporter-C (MgtC) family protein